MIAIHARTRAQKFEGKADWDVIAEAKTKVKIPLVGNGDVTSAAEARRMLDETGCDAVMVGRASFGNPWIFREARALLAGRDLPAPPTPRERLAALVRQFDLLATIRNERHASHEIRKHVAWYVKGLPHAAPFKERGQKIESPAELRALASDYLAELEAKGLADLPGGRVVVLEEADDGSAESASLAAQEA
jgi:tRNA-dihydrouridine synthase B